MRHLKKILVGLSCIFILNCTTAWSEVENKNVGSFLNAGEILGKNEAQLKEELGEPASKVDNGCRVPAPGPEGTLASGQAWSYAVEVPGSSVSLNVCLLKGISVAYRQQGYAETPDGAVYRVQREALHLKLIADLLSPHGKQSFSLPDKIHPNNGILI